MAFMNPFIDLKLAFDNFRAWFWDPEVWLPPGVTTWDQVKPTEKFRYPNFDDLLPWGIVLSVVFILVRYFIVEPFFIKPIGRHFGIVDSTYRAARCVSKHKMDTQTLPNNEDHTCTLEDKNGTQLDSVSQRNSFYQSKLTVKQFQELQLNPLCNNSKPIDKLTKRKQLENLSTNQRIRKSYNRKMFKLCDCCWQLTYYVLYCIMGCIVLWDKPWLTDIHECFRKFPYHDVSDDVWWYYMVALGYYGSSIVTFMWQHQRKDATQMLLHHIVTVILIVLSWAVNLVRAGTLILIVHEVADIPLLFAKAVGYCGYQHWMDYLFVVFIAVWVTTRLGLYPFWIIWCSIFDAPSVVGAMYPIYYIFNGLLILLLVFHIFWTILIAKIVIRKLKTTEVKDVRSDSEGSDDDVENDEVKKKK